ncbi:MAG: VIT1/CCC1 transporter family protein [Actinomycetota bacterium]|jgi:VIT1/CCC1 family predicted Fe2+/Mn2+ transporter|nr:VIT1/CCC1 transporter family protein [Actinomycetota bacterium]
MAHHIHDHHKDVHGGALRASVFGASDGLVSNVLLIIGVAGADVSTSTVRVTGIVGLLAGAISMAAGEYVSVRAQADLVKGELDRERTALAEEPEHETEELAELYVERGLDLEQATAVAQALMANPETALRVHAREELGVDPDDLSSPWVAAFSSLFAFAFGAFLPLIPWFFGSGNVAIWASLCLAFVGAALIGVLLSLQTQQSMWRTVARQVGIAAGAAVITYAIGSAVGVQVS